MRTLIILFLMFFALAGCATPNNAGPYQPEWQTECNASCATGYQIRWEQLLAAPRGDVLAQELEQQCVEDLARQGCTWPICECRAQEKR
jgi:hypothetical protein